jgi:hypothetical protein
MENKDDVQEKKEFNVVDFVIAYEGDHLNDEEIIKGFQQLIDSGLAWQLQGHYGRAAMSLIKDGHCRKK